MGLIFLRLFQIYLWKKLSKTWHRADLLETEPNADALIAKILHRAELEYQFCSAGDADPVTLQMQKTCAEYDLTDGFPYTFYKEVVSKVILYRDTHIEVRLQNGQIV